MNSERRLGPDIVTALVKTANECSHSVRNYLLVIALLSFAVLSNLGGTLEGTIFHPEIVKESLTTLRPFIEAHKSIVETISSEQNQRGAALSHELDTLPKKYKKLLWYVLCENLHYYGRPSSCDGVLRLPDAPRLSDVPEIPAQLAYIDNLLFQYADVRRYMVSSNGALPIYPNLIFLATCPYGDALVQSLVEFGNISETAISGYLSPEDFARGRCFGIDLSPFVAVEQ